MSTPRKPVDAFAASIATRAIKEGTKHAAQAELDAQAADVAAYQQYHATRSTNPFAAAAFRQHHSAAIERGRQLTEVANAARPEPVVLPSATSAAQQVADRMVFDQHAELTKTNPIQAASFRLENADAIARGSKVTIPAPEPTPPNPPPDDPPPQAA